MKRHENKYDKFISFRIPDYLRKEVEDYAKCNNVNRSEAIRDLLDIALSALGISEAMEILNNQLSK